MNATKLPSGNYRCRYYDQRTGKYKSFTAPKKAEAIRMAEEYKINHDPSRDVLIGNLADDYIESRTQVVSPTTLRLYKGYRKYHFGDIEKLSLNELNDRAVQKWVNKLATNHSPKTVRNVYDFLTAVVKFYDPAVSFRVKLPMKVCHDLDMPSEEDVRALINEADGEMQTIIQLAVFCCLRRGEICALQAEDIHDGYISVRHSMVKDGDNWVRKTPKTYSSNRDVPCPDYILAKLKDKAHPITLNPTQVSKRWHRMCRAHGYSFSFHSLRHFSASLMLTVAPVIDVEKMGGWTHGSGTLQRVYAYNVRESLSASQQKWVDMADTWQTP